MSKQHRLTGKIPSGPRWTKRNTLTHEKFPMWMVNTGLPLEQERDGTL